MRFAERVLHGVDDDGSREEIVIWIERRPGAVWAVGRAINPRNRSIVEPIDDDYVFEGFELGDALEAANGALEDDVRVLEDDGSTDRNLLRSLLLILVGVCFAWLGDLRRLRLGIDVQKVALQSVIHLPLMDVDAVLNLGQLRKSRDVHSRMLFVVIVIQVADIARGRSFCKPLRQSFANNILGTDNRPILARLSCVDEDLQNFSSGVPSDIGGIDQHEVTGGLGHLDRVFPSDSFCRSGLAASVD